METSAVRLRAHVVGCLTIRKQLLKNATGDGAAGNKERDKETTAGSQEILRLTVFSTTHPRTRGGHPGSDANLGRCRALAQPPIRKSDKENRSRRYGQRRGAERRTASPSFCSNAAPRSSMGSAEVPIVPGSVHGIPRRLRSSK
ncbi:hypothetical protein MRX96_018683 [Rhipicephalus microplus]